MLAEKRLTGSQGPRLLEEIKERPRVKHYGIPTEEQCVQWIRRSIFFRGKRYPGRWGRRK
jgi:hypothetical protein